MTDKERYQRTFSLLHASGDRFVEVSNMKNVKIMPVRRFVAVCAAALMVAAMATVAYAADVGGIQRAVQVWIHGDQTDAVLDIQGGSYTLNYLDQEGQQHTMGGGGVAIDDNGKERPLTEDEIMEHLDYPQVDFQEDGSVWAYYHNQKMEITDKFENGVCYVQVKDGKQVFYLTVEETGGYTISPHGYEKPTP